ncbi:inactive N-acetylated-alpha-linked acidic dipeptidase-like protein 2 isoform X1 [Tachysurus ichikawai]
MTAEAILRLATDPVLPFLPLDIALDIQNKLKERVTESQGSPLSPLCGAVLLTLNIHADTERDRLRWDHASTTVPPRPQQPLPPPLCQSG